MNGLMLFAWYAGDLIYRRIRKFDYADYRGSNIFRVHIRSYRGPDLIISGQMLRQGDMVGELHLYNYRLQRRLKGIVSEAKMGLITLREVRNSLPPLAEFLDTHPAGQNVKALIGTSILHRGAVGLGFEVFDLEDALYKTVKTISLQWMMRLCHPAGNQRLKRKSHQLIPKQMIMMRGVFIELYGQQSSVQYGGI